MLEKKRFSSLQKQIPFGTELEIAGFDILLNQQDFPNLKIPYQIDLKHESNKKSDYKTWLFTQDSTIMKMSKGVEVISPISYLDYHFLTNLFQICNFIEQRGGYVDDNCAFHIHVGFPIFRFNLEALKKLILLMAYYEPELNRFFAGSEFHIRLLGRNFWARNITPVLLNLEKGYNLFHLENYHQFCHMIKGIDKTYALNFKNISLEDVILRNTIELRNPNASLSPFILSNNIYTFLKMVEYCFRNPNWKYIYYQFMEVANEKTRVPEPNKALELAVKIFQKKKDIQYFRMQYEKEEDFRRLVKKRIV